MQPDIRRRRAPGATSARLSQGASSTSSLLLVTLVQNDIEGTAHPPTRDAAHTGTSRSTTNATRATGLGSSKRSAEQQYDHEEEEEALACRDVD